MSPIFARRRDFLKLTLSHAGAAALSSCAPRRHEQDVPLWFTYGGKNRQVLEALVTAYNALGRGPRVRPIFQGDYYEGLAKLRTAIAAGVPPALTHVVGEVIPYLAEAHVLEQLDGYPGAADLDVIPQLGQAQTWRGGAQHPLVCLPFNRSTPIAYLNAEVFERAGLGAPETWGELKRVAQQLSRPAPDRRYGFACPVSWWFWVALVGQAGGAVVEADGTPSLGGPAGVEALQLWQWLVERGAMKVPSGRDYNAWEQTNQDFLAGRAAMIWTSTAFLRYLEDNAPFSVRAVPLPAHVTSAVPTGGTHWVIPRGAPPEQKRGAWEFLRFLQEPAQAARWASETGYMPVTHGGRALLERTGFYARHPNDQVAVRQLAYAQPWPWSPELFRIEREIVQPRLEQVVFQGAPPQTMLAEARRLAQRAVAPQGASHP